MMTLDEARERAERIWPILAPTVRRLPGTSIDDTKPGAGHWSVDTSDGAAHELDGNGHTVCHETCTRLEAQIANLDPYYGDAEDDPDQRPDNHGDPDFGEDDPR